MNILLDAWSVFRTNLAGVLSTINIIDFLDIIVVAYLFYQMMRLVRETRAMQLLKGIAAIFGLYFVALTLGMSTLSFIIKNILGAGIIVIAVVFQPELRRALEQLGRTKISSIGRSESTENVQERTLEMIEAVCSAAAYLSARKTGALMVIERETRLGEIIKTGTEIDAKPSLELIANLFFPNSPLHDGAVIIRQGRLQSAGCFLPLSANMDIGRELGTRHRAALGMSEQSDAVVVVVSEETGAISVAVDSRLQRGLSAKNLEKLVGAKLTGGKSDEEASSSRVPFWRKKK